MPIIVWAVIGGVAGFLWHKILRCAGKTCPIVGNMYLSILIGILIGLLVSAGI
ncbi:MAG: YtxH domain-containing protein [Elusimicrobiota bacterium]